MNVKGVPLSIGVYRSSMTHQKGSLYHTKIPPLTTINFLAKFYAPYLKSQIFPNYTYQW